MIKAFKLWPFKFISKLQKHEVWTQTQRYDGMRENNHHACNKITYVSVGLLSACSDTRG